MRIHAEAPVHATEDPQRVAEAVQAFFPDAKATVEPGLAWLESDSPEALRDRVWELRIIDTFRSALLSALEGDHITIRLSKQAALGARISFPPTPHALGDLRVTFQVEQADSWPDPEAFCWWLCPRTEAGKIVGDPDAPA